MAKKNQLIINLGKHKLTAEQRKILHAAIHKTVSKNLPSPAKTRNQATALTRDIPPAANALKTATLDVSFFNVGSGLSELTASFDTQSKKITSSGTIVITGLSKGDFIEIDGSSAGNTTISIDIDAKPAVMNFTPGSFNDNFLIK